MWIFRPGGQLSGKRTSMMRPMNRQGWQPRRHSCPLTSSKRFFDVTRRCELVQRRLVQIATTLFQEKRILFDRPIPVPKVPKVSKQWERNLAKRMLNSSHKAARTGFKGCRVVCTECHKGGRSRKAGKLLVSLCPAVAGVDPAQDLERGVHRSHSILEKNGVRICSSCGYFTVTRVRKLKDACQGNLSKARKSDLNNWAIDLPPNGLDRWPVFPPGASR